MTRITQQQLESYLWGAATILRGTIDAGDYKQFIFPLLFFKRLCDVFDEETLIALRESDGDQDFALFPENHRFQVPTESHWKELRKVSRDVGGAIQRSMRSIETANQDKLFGIFGDAQWSNKDRLSDAMLRDLVEHFCSLELSVANLPEDELGQGYEFLIKKFADDAGHTAAEFYTNRTVVHLMTEILDVQPGESVYDPTCGSGGMLLSCIAHLRNQKKEWRNVKLYGQERNLMTSSIARMNCFLHGIEDFRIERGDTLAEPKLVEGDRLQRFDVVLANPPYSIKQWNREAFAADPWGRNVFGVPPQGRADYAFQQHILQSLKPKTGRCAVLWPHGILFRNEEDDIRRKFIESDYIEAVIGLGPNLFYNSSMQSCIVVCRTKKTPVQRNKILFIDASNEVTRERTQSFLAPDHLNNILQSYREFSSSGGFATVATLEEIKANDWSLNIPLYVKTTGGNYKSDASGSKGNPDAALDAWMESSHAGRLALTGLLPTLATDGHVRNFRPSTDRFIQSLDRKSWRKVQLAEVCEEISIRVDNPALSGQSRFVGLEHFDSGELKIRRWGSPENLDSSMKSFLSGDVLFARRNAYLKRASLADFGGLCSGDAIVLRENRELFVPGFLAFILNTDRFWEFAIANAAGTMSRRVNGKTLMRYEFHLPSLEQQRRIAGILWAVDEQRNRFLEARGAASDYRKSLFGQSLEQFPARPLVEVAEFLDGKRVPLSEKERAKRKGPYPYYGASGVIDSVDGYLFDEPLVLLSEDGFNLVNRNSRIAFKVEGKVWINNHAHVLRPKPETNIDFLADYLESISLDPYITGTYQRKLNKSECERIPVPFPPARVQNEIASTIGQIVEAIAAIDRQISASSELTSSLFTQLTTPRP